MTTRPSLFAFGATLAALVFVGSLGFTPILVSHDSPPGAPVRFWRARLAPRSYAVYALRSAPAVIVPEAPTSCPDPESQTRAWLTLAAGPDADHVLRHLFASSHAPTRLYALLGLAHIGSPVLLRALIVSQRDSAMVRLVLWPAPKLQDTTVAFATLASAERVRSLAQMLGQVGPRCAA